MNVNLNFRVEELLAMLFLAGFVWRMGVIVANDLSGWINRKVNEWAKK